jgi:putative redox protein
MKTTTRWTEKMKFTGTDGNHSVQMDTRSPIGSDSALSPKQLLLTSISGCSAMDVVAFMKKHHQTLETFEVDAEGEMTSGYPAIFKEVHLTFRATGAVEAARLVESVQLSQSKYCGVSAMIVKAVPIRYTVILNDETVGTGHAQF